MTKYEQLSAYLKNLGSVMLAFSGGVDSTFLLLAAQEALGNKVKAVTVVSPYTPRWEVEEARSLARELKVEHEIIERGIPEAIRNNPENRCYLCKREIFTEICALAKLQGFAHVADGTNFDDLGDYRPGLQALRELKIKSPLLECRIGKAEIRELSKGKELKTWDKPPYACLLTRLPYGREVTVEELVRIEKAERSLMKLGFLAVRVRSHGDLARIELDKAAEDSLLEPSVRSAALTACREAGFRYVTLDLEGYRVGSFNETIKKPDRNLSEAAVMGEENE